MRNLELRRAYMAMKMTSFHRQTKQKAVEYKGGKCEKCGYDKSLAALVFHHRDPKEKDFRISEKNRKWEQIEAELDKCDLLCSNCHHEEHERIAEIGRKERYEKIRSLVPEKTPGPILKTECSTCKKPIRRLESEARGKEIFCSLECVSKNQEKAKWPDKRELETLVWKNPATHLAKIFGVSDKAIKKRCKKLGIETPGPGYWTGVKI
jgi:hypothetical protein